MKRLPRKPIATWLCLVAYVLAGVLGARGLVLCIGPSGHMAIEVAAFGDCAGCIDPGVVDQDVPTIALDDAGDCPCDDIALPGTEMQTQKFEAGRWTELPPRLLSARAFARDDSGAPRVRIPAWDRSAQAQRKAGARVRSVVLLV